MEDKSTLKLSQFLVLPVLAGLILIGLTVFWFEAAWLKAVTILLVSGLLAFRFESLRAKLEQTVAEVVLEKEETTTVC